MKRYLVLAGIALAGAMVGVMVKTVVAAHTAAAQPPATNTAAPAGAAA